MYWIEPTARSKLSRKTLICLRADLCSFLKYCRKAKLTTMFPENLTIPTAAAGRKDGTAAAGLCGTVQQRSYYVLWEGGTG